MQNARLVKGRASPEYGIQQICRLPSQAIIPFPDKPAGGSALFYGRFPSHDKLYVYGANFKLLAGLLAGFKLRGSLAQTTRRPMFETSWRNAVRVASGTARLKCSTNERVFDVIRPQAATERKYSMLTDPGPDQHACRGTSTCPQAFDVDASLLTGCHCPESRSWNSRAKYATRARIPWQRCTLTPTPAPAQASGS